MIETIKFEDAVQLKELGVIQKSHFYWNWGTKNPDTPLERVECDLSESPVHKDDDRWCSESFSAFTACEILAKLPWVIDPSTRQDIGYDRFYLEIIKSEYNYICRYRSYPNDTLILDLGKNRYLVESLATVYISLLKKGFIEI